MDKAVGIMRIVAKIIPALRMGYVFFLSWLLVVRSDGIYILIDYICRLAGVRRLERARLEGDPRSVAGFHQKERIL